MENKMINITQETLDGLSIEEIVDLKMEVDDLNDKIDSIIKTCQENLIYN